MKQAGITEEKARELYNLLKAKPLKSELAISASMIKEKVKPAELHGMSSAQAAPLVTLLAKVAHQYDFDAFHGALTTGEVPSIKLSQAEMEVLNGGAISTGAKVAIVATVCICILICCL